MKEEIINKKNELCNVGTFAQVVRVQRNPSITEESETTATALLVAHRRIDLLSVDSLGPPIDVTVKHWDKIELKLDTKLEKNRIRALTNTILKTIREIAQQNSIFRDHLCIIKKLVIRLHQSQPHCMRS